MGRYSPEGGHRVDEVITGGRSSAWGGTRRREVTGLRRCLPDGGGALRVEEVFAGLRRRRRRMRRRGRRKEEEEEGKMQ